MKQSEFESLDQVISELKKRSYRAIVLCGLPGSGKSSLGLRLTKEDGYEYLSSDLARTEILKFNKAKFSSGEKEYLGYKGTVYEYLRKKGGELLGEGKNVIFDATHLNEQRAILLDFLKGIGVKSDELLIIWVDGGEKENVRKRFFKKEGVNGDGRSWEEAWMVAYDFFVKEIKEGKVTIPRGEEYGYQVVTVRNYV